MSALVNTFDDALNEALFQEEEAFDITCTKLLHADKGCKSKNIFFEVLCLKNDSYSMRMIAFCRENNISFTTPISKSLEANRNIYYLPDGHPTSLLHRQYAEVLFAMVATFP